MNEPNSDRPARRPRYRGTHPRRFHEKYKELSAEQYPDDVEKVLAGGRTPAGSHRPIMVREILEGLAPQPGESALDCTLGYGGHALELLKAVQPGGRILAIDADPLELPRAEARLRATGCPAEAVIVKRMNFAGVSRWLSTTAPEGVDVLLADLGLSSMQIDNPARGFSFKLEGPLDMRMNPGHGQPASALLSKLDVEDLAALLNDNADEPDAQLLAEAVLKAHHQQPLQTTQQLAGVVRATLRRASRLTAEETQTSIRRVFQALRIAVNDEFGALDELLRTLPWCLKSGGRAAFLTFHSGEDRRVKRAFRAGLQSGLYASISEEVIRPGFEELRANPRSSSARLRFAVRAELETPAVQATEEAG